MTRIGKARALVGAAAAMASTAALAQPHSVARLWNEQALEAIRRDYARPTIHARNLYHLSVAMWDAWAAYDPSARHVLGDERARARDVAAARREAISYAAYRLLVHRYRYSPGGLDSLASFDALMAELGYRTERDQTTGGRPAAVGNHIGLTVIEHGEADGADELGLYAFSRDYQSVNRPMVVADSGVGDLVAADRWQPLALRVSVDQAGRRLPSGIQRFLGAHWGAVTPFALLPSDREAAALYHDPGPPPSLSGEPTSYRDTFLEVLRYGATLTPDDGVTIDISPGRRGASTLGSNDGQGHRLDPATGTSYAANVVKRGDWSRVIAEFWADGPDSETPPGHWNTLANYVSDHPRFAPRLGGEGPPLDRLEWDVKLYLALNGAMHDAAVSAWGIKAHYDYVRPITAIRYMAGLGQSSEPTLESYHPSGLTLEPGLVELVTDESAQPGQRHEALAEHVEEIAVYGWLGVPENPEMEYGGVGWLRGVDWVPYQRETFVTPPFAGYVSGHSTFSRAGAEVLAAMTGSEFFPGGLGEFVAPADEYLAFESGPSETIRLQWATYYDAADEAGLSRLYGGIHPPVDDLPGRVIGAKIGRTAIARALHYFGGP